MKHLLLTTIFLASCENITPEQVYRVHEMYHIATGEPCLIAIPCK